ncbi:MAG: hypothetical protein KDC84_12730 [Crocinitomicaceae bacterium]|nr:hypothetical protein [Crocinitomicaceae bacterium]
MKARRIVQYSKMGSELAAIFSKMTLNGIEDAITEIFDPKSQMRKKAVYLETNDCNYLVVLDNYKFAKSYDEDEDDDGGYEDDFDFGSDADDSDDDDDMDY